MQTDERITNWPHGYLPRVTARFGLFYIALYNGFLLRYKPRLVRVSFRVIVRVRVRVGVGVS
eukprot:1391898-Amorphochlora_amoeboformis.AAC.1